MPKKCHFTGIPFLLYGLYCLFIAHKIATELGKTEDAAMFADRLKVQRTATHSDTYDPATGNYLAGLQVNQAFALIAGVTPKSQQQKVYDNLVDKMLYGLPSAIPPR